MALTYSSLLFPILLSFILASTSSSSSAPFSPSSVASSQLKFWSKNVKGTMPKALHAKLSPLSIQNSSYFALLLSEKSFSSFVNPSFCSQANLACSSSKFSNYDEIQNGYNGYAKTRLSENSKKQLNTNSFFRMSILQKGNHVELPNLHDHFPPRSFLPYEIASRISLKTDRKGAFGDQELLQKLFPESFSSPATKDAIRTTLLYCSAPNLRGEHKSCPKSLEEMVEFVGKVLGQKNPKVALTSKNENGSGKMLVIGKVKKFRAENFVACHEVFLPFATYLCHLLSSTYLYSIDFVDDSYKTRAPPVNTLLAICHLDTSEWPEDHVAFKILKSSPGKGEACHFLTQIDLVWVRLLEGGSM